MEKLNKSSSQKQATKLLELRQQLRTLLLHKFENKFKFSKAKFYALGNRAGSLLAKQVKAQHKKKQNSFPLSPYYEATLNQPAGNR